MSKVSEAKERQGWLKKAPTCSQCKHFSFKEEETEWGHIKETHLRCELGGFKVGKSNWCEEYCR